MSREDRKREDESYRTWKGAYKAYDLVREAALAVGLALGTGSVRHLWFIHLESWFGVAHPINSAQDFVLAPLGSITGRPHFRARCPPTRTPGKVPDSVDERVRESARERDRNTERHVSVKPGNYGPLPTTMGSLLTFAQSGGLDARC
jgi:hypothetical protein